MREPRCCSITRRDLPPLLNVDRVCLLYALQKRGNLRVLHVELAAEVFDVCLKSRAFFRRLIRGTVNEWLAVHS